MVRQLLRGRKLGQEASKRKTQVRREQEKIGNRRLQNCSRDQVSNQKSARLANDAVSEASGPSLCTGEHHPTGGDCYWHQLATTL